MGRPSGFVRLGIVAGIAGGSLLLGACSRPGGEAAATTTPVVTVRTSPSVATPATRVATANPPTAAPSVAPVATVPPTAVPVAATATAVPAAGRKYAVQPGDTLSGIAEQFGVPIQSIIDANKLANPDLLLPGQELIIPAQ